MAGLGGESLDQSNGKHGLLLKWYLRIRQVRDAFSFFLSQDDKLCNAIITSFIDEPHLVLIARSQLNFLVVRCTAIDYIDTAILLVVFET